MEKDIFKFDDFVTGDKLSDLQKMKSMLVKEGLFSDREGQDDEADANSYLFAEDESAKDEVINQDLNPYKGGSSEAEDDEDNDAEINPYESEEENEQYESKSESDEYYKLFKDKAEDFVCDIAIEGVDSADTEVRLIIESDDWTLMFRGEIKKGKCIIPIKKLNIFNEGQKGKIKLEVNADGNLFTPWEDDFIVKVSKKVTVKLNESKGTKPKIPVKKGLGVKVNVRK